jgi:hypothetical protein
MWYNARTPLTEEVAKGTHTNMRGEQMVLGCVFFLLKLLGCYRSSTGYALYKHFFDLLWKQPNCSFPVYLLLQYRRPPPVDKSTLVGFFPFFPAPFAFCISELLSVAVAALLEDMMLANDNAGAADGPA